MKKKALSVILAALLALALCAPAFAADTQIKVNLPSGKIAAGEVFLVTVEIENNPGVNALNFTLSYDSSVLKCDAVRGGEVLQSMIYVTNPAADVGAIVAAAATSAATGDGELALYKFTALRDIDNLSLELIDAAFSDLDGNNIPFDTVYETYTIKSENENSGAEPSAEPSTGEGETSNEGGQSEETAGGENGEEGTNTPSGEENAPEESETHETDLSERSIDEIFADIGEDGTDIGTGGYDLDEILAPSSEPETEETPAATEEPAEDTTQGENSEEQPTAEPTETAEENASEPTDGESSASGESAAETGENRAAEEIAEDAEETEKSSGGNGVIWIILACVAAVAVAAVVVIKKIKK